METLTIEVIGEDALIEKELLRKGVGWRMGGESVCFKQWRIGGMR